MALVEADLIVAFSRSSLPGEFELPCHVLLSDHEILCLGAEVLVNIVSKTQPIQPVSIQASYWRENDHNMCNRLENTRPSILALSVMSA